MKWMALVAALVVFINDSPKAQNAVKGTYILEGGKNYKGKLKINAKKNTIRMLAFVPDSTFGFTGTCEFTDDERIRIILDAKSKEVNDIEEFVIEGECFILNEKYRFCRK